VDKQSLTEEYMDAARRHGLAIERGDSNIANKMYDKITDLAKKIRSQPNNGRETLYQMLEDKDVHVQGWAASHLLVVDSHRAVATLEALGRSQGVVGLNARMVLQEWRKGLLKGL
jgi:RecA/RadA recombinase